MSRENPLGAGGFAGRTIRVGSNGRVHLLHFNGEGYALCGAGKQSGDVTASASATVDCYRCLKVLRMESSGAALAKRDLRRIGGHREKNVMIPGGREGVYISGKKKSPASPHGLEDFLGGTKRHPTQPRLLRGGAKTLRGRNLIQMLTNGFLRNPYEVPVDLMDILGESPLIEAYASDIESAIFNSKDPVGTLRAKALTAKSSGKRQAFLDAATALEDILS